MPTIKQLPAATSVSTTDVIPVSQGGTTRSLSVGSLLSSTQGAIALASGKLLGRASATAGGPEPVSVGSGIALLGGVMSATGEDHTRLPVAAGLSAGDEVVVNSVGAAKRIPATALRGLFTAGSGVTIDASGSISSSGGGLATASTVGAVKPGTGLVIGADGTLSADSAFVRGTAAQASVVATGASVSRALADRFSDVVHLRDFPGVWDGVADDGPAFAAVAAALRDTHKTLLTEGCRIRIASGNTIWLQGFHIRGPGLRDVSPPYGLKGGTFLIDRIDAPPFAAGACWAIRGCIFFWPKQVENGSSHIPYPALIGPHADDQALSWAFEDNHIVNAFDVIDLSANVSGGFYVRSNLGFALGTVLSIGWMPVESWMSDNDWTPYSYQHIALAIGGTRHLRDVAATEGCVLRVVGDGSDSVAPSRAVDGLISSGNYVFGFGYGIRVQGGFLDLYTATADRYDGVGRVLSIEFGGFVTGAMTGGLWDCYTFGSSATGAAVFSAADAFPGTTLTVDGVFAPSIAGPLIDWSAPAGGLSLIGVNAVGLNNVSNGTGPGLLISSLGARVSVVGGTIAVQGSSGGAGIDVRKTLQSLSIIGVQFVSCLMAVSVGGDFAPAQSIISGCTAVGTRGITCLGGSRIGSVANVGNSWDKGDGGTAGPVGPPGAAGPAGSAGLQGAIGPTGSKGDTGGPGPAGPVGPSGVQGLPGSTGPAGAKGDTGAVGPAGMAGPAGPAGATGAAGAAGPSGSPATPVTSNYSGSGAIAVSDSLALVNSAALCAMTLGTGVVDGQRLTIKRYGSGSVTITLNLDGAASSVIAANSPTQKEAISLAWSSPLSTWLVL